MTVWLVGGLDPTGGAGVARDRATAAAVAPELDVVEVVTADTEQGDGRPARVHPRARDELARALAAMPPPTAVKLGLVPDALVQTVLHVLAPLECPIVVDPVMHASDGGSLGASPEGLRTLARVATVVTPNRMEGLALALACPPIGDAEALLAALGRELAPAAVLLKGGHEADEASVCDRLWRGGVVTRFARPRIAGPDPRGTGCALATAVACELARAADLVDACARAIAWLDDARTRTVPGPDGRPHLPG